MRINEKLPVKQVEKLITADILRELIERVLRQAKFSLRKREEATLDASMELFNELYPKNIFSKPQKYLRIWCGRTIAMVKAEYPTVEDRLNTIKQTIWDEIMYFVYRERFDFAEEKFLQEKPTVNGRWITHTCGFKCLFRDRKPLVEGIKPTSNEFIMKKIGVPETHNKYKEMNAPFIKLANTILLKLEEIRPIHWGPSWIQDNVSEKTYHTIGRRIGLSEGGKYEKDWTPFIVLFPKKWQKRWFHYYGFETLTFASCVSRIRKLLKELQPESLDPKWIIKNDPKAYYKLQKLLAKKNERLVWLPFLSQLPECWQSKWHEHGSYLHYEKYENVDEVEKLLEPYKNKLYLIVYYPLIKKSERATANVIANTLIGNAQNGNVAAYKRLAEDVSHVCYQWMETDRFIRRLQKNPQYTGYVIRACIYNYRAKKNTSFFVYLLGSLRFHAMRSPYENEFYDSCGIDEENSTDWQ